MKTFNYGYKPLTNEQLEQVAAWENNPDPVHRLFTKYYEWSRQIIMDDYFEELNESGEGVVFNDDAWEAMERKNKKLLKDYERDLTLFLSMQQTFMGWYCPVRIRVALAENEE